MGMLDSVGQWLELIFCHLSNPAKEKTLNLSVSKDGKWPKCRTAMQAITQIFCRGAQIGVIVFACIALSRTDPGEDSAHKKVCLASVIAPSEFRAMRWILCTT